MSSDRVTIQFAGRSISCRRDTTVAVALWENGIRHLSHSHKYGKDRGLTCARGHCTACLMRVDGVPNVRTCTTDVHEGMSVEIQDAGAFYGPPMQKMLSLGGALFPVGFYYKWFTKPAALSRFFLDRIRPLTGIGRLPEDRHALRALPPAPQDGDDPIEVPTTELGEIGTLVVGAGPSGLEAALEADGPVTIIDDHDAPGGQRALALDALAASDRVGLDRFDALKAMHRRVDDLRARLAQRDDIQFRAGTLAIAGYNPGGLVLRCDDTLLTASTRNLVWTAGALDRLGLFAGNDTPGVIGPRALYRLITRDGLDVAGQRVLIIGGGLDFWLSAALLADKGASVSLVVTEQGHQAEVSAAVDLGWQLTTGLELDEIRPEGQRGIEAAFAPAAGTPGPAHSHLKLKADFAVICGRGKPAYDIIYQLGADLANQPDLGGYLPRSADGGPFTGEMPGGVALQVRGEAAGTLPGNPDSGKAEVS